MYDAREKLGDVGTKMKQVGRIITDWTSKLLSKRRSKAALLVGLDNAGKTSILLGIPEVRERLRTFATDNDAEVSLKPTTALQLVPFRMTRSSRRCRRAVVKWQIWDMSGQGRHRPLWLYYCGLIQAIVFVVDVTDLDRLPVAKTELATLCKHPAVAGLPLLILANKIDLSHSSDDLSSPVSQASLTPQTHRSPHHTKGNVSLEVLRTTLDIDNLQTNHNLKINVVACSAETGSGIPDAFQWLTDHVAW